jgi:hypothetical protein
MDTNMSKFKPFHTTDLGSVTTEQHLFDEAQLHDFGFINMLQGMDPERCVITLLDICTCILINSHFLH